MKNNLSEFVGYIMIALLIGFALNIVLVLLRKVTKIRTLFITGHIMQQANTALWMLLFLFPQFRSMTGVALVGIFAGKFIGQLHLTLSVEPTQRLTGMLDLQ